MSSTLKIFLEHTRSLKILRKGDLKQDNKSLLFFETKTFLVSFPHRKRSFHPWFYLNEFIFLDIVNLLYINNFV